MSAFSETSRLEARVAELEAMNAEQSQSLTELAQRLHEAEADRDDYERRWIAECRAHGATLARLAGTEPPLVVSDLEGVRFSSEEEADAARDLVESLLSKP